MVQKNPYLDFLEHRPDVAFSSHLSDPGRGLNSGQQRTLRSSFSDIQGKFLGMLGDQIRQGEAPTARFNDYLEGFDFKDYYKRLAPTQRFGRSQSLYSPRVRHLLKY